MSRFSSLNVLACSATTLVVLVAGRAACRCSGPSAPSCPAPRPAPRRTRGTASAIFFDVRRRRSPSAALSSSFFSSSVMLARRLNRCVSMTMPSTPDGTSSESFFTSSPARPKIACSSFSSGVSSLRRLRRHLADQDVARLDERADRTMPCSSRFDSAFGRDVRDVAGELLLAELRLADLDLELLDVDRGVGVVLHQPLADDDRVLEVVAVPGHERDQHVAAQGQLAVVRGGAVGDDLALLHLLARS